MVGHFPPRTINDFEILPEVKKALNLFHDLDFLNIVVTNQPDIARCLMSEQILNGMHDLIRQNLVVDDIFVCPHDDSDYCLCRKPKPWNDNGCSEKNGISISQIPILSVIHGKISMQAEQLVVSTILLDRPYNEGLESDYRVRSLLDVNNIINNLNV